MKALSIRLKTLRLILPNTALLLYVATLAILVGSHLTILLKKLKIQTGYYLKIKLISN